MDDDARVTLGELRGFLEAFASFNDKTNHGFTFALDRLPAAASVASALDSYFRGTATRVSLLPIEDWPEVVGTLCKRWFFQFQVAGMDRLTDRGMDFSLSHEFGREAILDRVVKRLHDAIGPEAVWRVEVVTTGFYECEWDDIAFEGSSGRYLLHFGVSD